MNTIMPHFSHILVLLSLFSCFAVIPPAAETTIRKPVAEVPGGALYENGLVPPGEEAIRSLCEQHNAGWAYNPAGVIFYKKALPPDRLG